MYQIARFTISIAPVVIGGYLLFNAFTDITANNAAAQWPRVPGVITESTTSGTFSLYRRQSFISYNYEVNNNVYTGNRVSFGGGSASDYSKNQSVIVYYNPQNYAESVLEPGFRLGYFFTLLVGVGLVMIGRELWRRLK